MGGEAPPVATPNATVTTAREVSPRESAVKEAPAVAQGPRFAVEFGNSPARRIGEMMTTSVQTADVNADVVTLARSMVRNGIRSMPVLDRGRVIGVVTRRDFLRVLARPDQLLANDVRVRLAVFGEKDRWTVDVHDGEAMITDRFDSEADRQVATVLAEGVPGVIRARCHVGELAEGQT